ncbi:MAG: Antilisterial bacteriocin subtilosin biosynthesis protein AlbA [Firmicutes bacterium ADurb.Bin262]|nr:MAG: Antilisterial bacteriocin subtilosin biosynthesis protein AlbA [Firmicutes bacterium ADurb.Bin262]
MKRPSSPTNISISEKYFFTLFGRCREKRIPICGTLELTPRCNFKCKMCYIRLEPAQMKKIGRERTAAEWIELIKSAAQAGTLILQLTGGEVFLRSDFFEIYEKAVSLGIVPIILSNAYLIDEAAVKRLAGHPPYSVSVSLYGASNATYQKLCGVRDGFDVVLRNLLLMKENGIPIELKMTVTKENVKDFSAVEKIARENNWQFRYGYHLNNPVRGAVSEGKAMSADFGSLPQNLLSAPGKNDSLLLFPKNCGSVNAAYCITWNGNMQLCPTASVPYTEPFQDGFINAWHSLCDQLTVIEGPNECKNCADKAFCGICLGKLYAETQDYGKVPASFCAEARERRESFENGQLASRHETNH